MGKSGHPGFNRSQAVKAKGMGIQSGAGAGAVKAAPMMPAAQAMPMAMQGRPSVKPAAPAMPKKSWLPRGALS